MTARVYVMRHGETEANVQRVLVGREDSPFTEAGQEQPARVARHLREVRLACIYTSPMERTRRTAEAVLATLGRELPVHAAPALSEIDAGAFTGLSFEEVRERAKQAGRHPLDFRYPGGETWAEVQARAVEFVSGLSDGHAEESVLAVTHAGVIAGLVAHVLDEPIERFIRTRFGHDFLGVLRVRGGEIVDYEKVVGTVDDWL